MNRAVFLDRDGVINRKAAPGLYITRWEDFEFLPGVEQGIAALTRGGFHVIVVTNQRCVAKGLITPTDIEVLHRRMQTELAHGGATVDAVYYCPHEIDLDCSCRKPAAGMLLRAAAEHRLDLTASWMVGDSEKDMKAGRNAHCSTIYIAEGSEAATADADLTASSLRDAAEQILKANHERARPRRLVRL